MCLWGNSYVSGLGEFSFGKWRTHQSRRWLVQFVSWLPSHLPPPLAFLPPSRKLRKRAFCLLFRKIALKFICALFICFDLCHSWAAVGYVEQSRWIPNLHIQAVCWERFNTTLPPPTLLFGGIQPTCYSFQFQYWDISALSFLHMPLKWFGRVLLACRRDVSLEISFLSMAKQQFESLLYWNLWLSIFIFPWWYNF